MLRLASSAVGPVQVSPGTAGTPQMVEAYNAGDGSLNLSVSSSVSWIAASVGSPQACVSTKDASTCLPLAINLSASSLAAGTYTGIVTVSDPNAVDAPQTITVTVRVGGLDMYIAPGTTADAQFTLGSLVTPTATTQDGSRWLTVALQGTGSFRFTYPYDINLAPPASMAAGTYSGSVVISGSKTASENQTIPVTMRVTTQPIAQATPSSLVIRLAQGAPPLLYPFSPTIAIGNLGAGTLSTPTVTISGGSWIKQDVVAPFFAIDPTGLSTGTYNASVAFASNAANGTVNVPVELDIVAQGAPLIYFQGVLDNGTFVPGDTVAQGDVMVAKGEQLSLSPYTPAQSAPLTTQLGGTSVLVNGVATPLFYTSYGQIAFQMPVDTAQGTAQVQVKRSDGSTSNTVTVSVGSRAPRLLVAVNQDGSINSAAHLADRGDTITIYAIGLGATSPPVATNQLAPSSPLAWATPTPDVSFGAEIGAPVAAPQYAGLTPGSIGLYQVNVTVPDNSPTGSVPVRVSFPDAASNDLAVWIQ